MKRRDFLKHAAIGGVLGALAERVHPSGLVSSAYESSAAAGTKLVFVSDLHLNADAGVSWINTHLPDLAAFFSSVGARTDVSELVILGDLVDDWVLPADRTPNSFEAILSADQNAAVVAALQAVCQKAIRVTYVTGNHDLLSFQQNNTKTLNKFFPGMTVVSDEPGLGAYARDGVLYAEHGHRYDLFNSPDTWSHPGSHLPLGYFIARSVATQSAREGQIYTLPDTSRSWASAVLSAPNLARSVQRLSALDSASEGRIREILRDPGGPARRLARSKRYPIDQWDDGFIDDDLVVLIFRIVALWAGEGPWSRFAMADEDGFAKDPRVRDVAQWYDEIFSQWPDRQNIVSADMAFWNDLDYMGSTADLLFEMPERIKPYYEFTPRIVLFGHTHKPVLQFHASGVSTIYANTGTWIDSKPMTWVEVEVPVEDAVDERKYTVSLWYWGDDKARYSASIDAAAT